MIPRASASSRASVTSRPELLVPSPDTSMVRRVASNGARSSSLTAKSMAPLIEVRSAKERGISASWAENLLALSRLRTMVQSITSFCAPAPDHSTKHTAMRPCGPEPIASSTRGLVIAAA